MASRFSPSLRQLTAALAFGMAALAPVGIHQAMAQTVHFNTPYQDDPSASSSKQKATRHGGEHFHATGRRPPPAGYQDAPSNEFQNGPDPEHQAKLRSNKDAVTGSNLGAFGNAYQDSNPVQSGQMGDATGNGWVAPRGNGF